MITSDRPLLLAVPTMDQRLLGAGFYLFLSLNSLRNFVSDAPRHYRQSRSEDNRYLTL